MRLRCGIVYEWQVRTIHRFQRSIEIYKCLPNFCLELSFLTVTNMRFKAVIKERHPYSVSAIRMSLWCAHFRDANLPGIYWNTFCIFAGDTNRPYLTTRVQDRNDYINAVFLPVSRCQGSDNSYHTFSHIGYGFPCCF